MKELLTRTLSGILFIILVIGSVMWNHYSFAGLFLLITAIGLYEFYRLMRHMTGEQGKAYTGFGIFLGIICYLIIALVALKLLPLYSVIIIFVLLLLPFMAGIFSGLTSSFNPAVNTMAGIIYVALPFGMLVMIGNPLTESGVYMPFVALGFFLLMWVYDVFAYLSGTLLGKHPLAKKISPKKSWEGFLGGAVFAIIASYILSLAFDQLNFVHWAVVALLIIIFGTLGDLAESMLKRQAVKKDSGGLIPGHGGVLDRFDGVLFSAPAVLIYLLLIWR